MNYNTGVLSLDLLVGGTFTAALALLLIFMVVDHLALGAGEEAVALRGFRKSRLGRMLYLRHLHAEDYLRFTSPASRRLHVAVCGSCAHKKECDTALKRGSAPDYSFCANGTMMERLLRDRTAA
jgi:hypothetical protein